MSESPGHLGRNRLAQAWQACMKRVSDSAWDRFVGGVLVLPTGLILGLAVWLEPDASGVGTHQQLGLDGCAILSVWGFPCPMCGMTTSFAYYAELSLVQGVLNQPFSIVLFGATVGMFVTGLLDTLVPKGRWRRGLAWILRNETRMAVGILSAMFLGWTYKYYLLAH